MAQIKKDTSLRKAILQAAITGQLISTVDAATHAVIEPVEITGGESLPLAAAGKPSSATPSPRGSAPKTPNEFASFENQNSVSERSERPTLPETGRQLLDRIIEERNKKLLAEWEEALKKNPKAKKPAPIVASEIDEDEIPFEIPENWCWCRLKDIFFMQAGKNISSSNIIEIQSDENPYPCFGGNGLRGYVSSFNKDGAYPIIGRQGALCGCINVATGKFYATEHAVVVDTFGICDYQWASWFLIALNLNQYATATAQPGLAVNKIETVLIPLPPLSVQNAIVAKLEQVLPLVDAYENAVLQKEELKSTLSDKVKKAILQEAITGKLTEQWRKSAAITESGEQLLDRIIKERNAKDLADWEEKVKNNPKAKKPVPVVASEIEEEEIPFEVPESWCWVKGGDSFVPMESTKPQGETFVYIDTDAVNNKLNIIDNPKDLLVKEAPSRASRKLHKGDVLFSMVRPYLKNIAFVEDRFADAIASTGFYVMTQIGIYNPKYLYYMVLSPYVIDGLHYFMKGDNSPSINTTDIDNFIYPLPPLEEQEEIVKKVEELLPLCINKGEFKNV